MDEWLQHRSAHYAWWRKVGTSVCPTSVALSKHQQQQQHSNDINRKTSMIAKIQTDRLKPPVAKDYSRCILWFQFTGHPFKMIKCNNNGQQQQQQQQLHATQPPLSTSLLSHRHHSIRIEQQPLGGAPACVFVADLVIGGTVSINWSINNFKPQNISFDALGWTFFLFLSTTTQMLMAVFCVQSNLPSFRDVSRDSR